MRSNVFILHKLKPVVGSMKPLGIADPPVVRLYRVDASTLAGRDRGREDFPTIHAALTKLANGPLICGQTEVIEFREVA